MSEELKQIQQGFESWWDRLTFKPSELRGTACRDTMRAAYIKGSKDQLARQAAPLTDHTDLLKEAIGALQLFIPSPQCRECADNNGTCPNNFGAPCDPDKRADYASNVRRKAITALGGKT